MLRIYQDVRSVDAYAAGVSGGGRASDARLGATLRRFFEDVSDPEDGICVVGGGGGTDVWVIADGYENFIFVMAPDGISSEPPASPEPCSGADLQKLKEGTARATDAK